MIPQLGYQTFPQEWDKCFSTLKSENPFLNTAAHFVIPLFVLCFWWIVKMIPVVLGLMQLES